jgi:hypothetical protein
MTDDKHESWLNRWCRAGIKECEHKVWGVGSEGDYLSRAQRTVAPIGSSSFTISKMGAYVHDSSNKNDSRERER